MPLPPIIDADEATSRVARIFPRTAFNNTLNGQLAGRAIAAMVYLGAIVPDGDPATEKSRLVRPSALLWLQASVLARSHDGDREAWFAAASRSNDARKRVIELVTGWGLPFDPWYADNSRETLRDETLKQMARLGAVKRRGDLPTTSGRPRWALSSGFAALFDPALTGPALDVAIEAWREANLTPDALLRIRTQQKRAGVGAAVIVLLPSGNARQLEPGQASEIIKGVIEAWAPARLIDPVVLTISEPGAKLASVDADEIAALGIAIDVRSVLPDVLIADLGSPAVTYWVVEAVASDGPVTEERREDLLAWATDQHIPVENMRFLSAFVSRGHTAARKRLRDLANGTYAWFLDEPRMDLSWREIQHDA